MTARYPLVLNGTTIQELQSSDVLNGYVTPSSTDTLTNKTLTSPVINTPTGIVKGDVGLGNADNTSDATKNAATATLTNKTLTSPVINTPTGIVKGDVGLGNIDNTSDATKNAATATLTNKTIAFASNTLTGVAATGANTFTGNQTVGDNQVIQAMIKDQGFVYFDSTTTSAINYTNGSNQRWAPSGTVTLSVTNWAPSGNLSELLIEGVNLGAATITWPTIYWIKSDGTTTTTFSANGVTLQSSGTDFVFLWTRDAGTTIYGKVIR